MRASACRGCPTDPSAANRGPPFGSGCCEATGIGTRSRNLGADLARLVSPFGAEDFAIRLEAPGRGGTADVRSVQLPEYMSEPKYRIAGTADTDGTIHWRYRYRPLGGTGGRDEARVEERGGSGDTQPTCGPFEFEIRAWDLSMDDTRDMAEHYREARSRIRGLIREHRGISLYRDDVLVLAEIGSCAGLARTRPAAHQPGGNASQYQSGCRLRADNQSEEIQTSRTPAIGSAGRHPPSQRSGFIAGVVEILENERDTDRDEKRKSAKDLFANINAAPLLSQMEGFRDEGGDVEDAISATRGFRGQTRTCKDRYRETGSATTTG